MPNLMPDDDKVKMSTAQSGAIFNGEVDNFYDQNYEMNNKMRLPKTLRVSDDEFNDDSTNKNGSSWTQSIPNKVYDMHMPDRILVVGHDQHVGLKAPPIEMTLENSVIPPEHTMTRVQTPPRVLTLGDHFFPTFDDDSIDDYGNPPEMNSTTPIANGTFISDTQIVRRNIREQTPVWNSTLDVSLPQSDEIQHLRRQLGKLNRRVMAVESVMYQRQQRDKYIYAITVAYFIFKAFNWITRN
ncbi:transport and Golgi organization protein 11 isoform X1 [Microplitis demolitor]|uniref:transport and Golgi organization protein 11 isoform X1 n=3 Tax=Microplitis demolitor TaxID=69319 RepID=UPI0004CDB85E|nr:transport and Golgi organization protein 11 isoform X1 [Microplitis demolitor]XP_014297153.1 transport and Golgi organization protein 11 isoform X1 [Microplitis demolitor]